MKSPTPFPLVLFLISAVPMLSGQEEKDAPPLPDVRGGLVVQLGADDAELPMALSRTGRYLVHVLDTNPRAVLAVRERLGGAGGFAFSEAVDAAAPLPYTENLVNAVVLRTLKTPAAEILRVLVPGGTLVIPKGNAPVDAAKVEAAGFEAVSRKGDGSVTARKPWPKDMDGWSHPRHGADGNPVSGDTEVGPPERVRWVAAAMAEVEGLVTDGGRNFYGGVLARDSFNGLRLWHRDLGRGDLNDPSFDLPRLSYDRARPVAAGEFLFAIAKGKLVALNAATGEVEQEYPGIGEPDEVISHRDLVIAADEVSVRAFSTRTAELLWSLDASDPRNLVAGGETVSLIRGNLKRGEKPEALALDLYTGKIKWQRADLPWLEKVYRTVINGDQLAFEESSLSDHDAGNVLHVLSSETGQPVWEKVFPPGMNHNRQARAMFVEDDLWILHGGKENTADKEKTTRSPIEVSSLDPKTGAVRKTFPAGLAHCFPPVATAKYVLAGVFDMTSLETGEVVANPITKANCSREGGWVPANGLVYTTPKHCTCWPMLRGFVALAPKSPEADNPADRPVEEIEFPLVKGPAAPDPNAAEPAADDWPTYRGDRWRSGSTQSAGPAALETRWSAQLADPGALPEGPIRYDWMENPFVKGPLSAPVIADGSVFLTRPDAHEVIAVDAATGGTRWRFTARGRVDTPPTIHRGLCLFGCHAGYVYALRADTGQPVWQLRAAPDEERIVAYGQVESAWPVPGSVLVRDGVAYFVAGRQPLADGGVLIFAADPMTGAKHWVYRLDEIPHKGDPTFQNPYEGFYENSGLEFDPVDILHQEGDRIAMSRWLLSLDGKDVQVDKWNAFARLDTGGGAVWAPRGSWTYGARHQDRFRGEAPRRPLVVYRDGQVFGQLNGSTDIFRRDFDAESVKKFDGKWITGWEAAQKGSKGEKPFRTYRIAEGAKWKVDPFTPAEEKAKPFKPGTQMSNDIHAMALAGNGRLYLVHKDGRMIVLNTADGSVAAEGQAPAPMWDGLAIADGKVFLTTLTGELLCLGVE